MTDAPVVSAERCTGCSLCVKDCPSMTLALEERLAVVAHPTWCIGCGHCEAVCPEDAIAAPLPLPAAAPVPGDGPAVDPERLMLLLRERRSVRRYRKDPVPRPLLEALVEAGRYAPTGSNSQNVRWIVLDSPESLDRVRTEAHAFYARIFGIARNPLGRVGLRLWAGKRMAESAAERLPVMEEAERRIAAGEDRLLFRAPALVLVHAPAWDTCSEFNACVALYNASLAAHAHGLGCCFDGFVEIAVNRHRPLKRWLGIPDEDRCQAALAVGWPAVRYRRLVERRPAVVRWM
jgi:nitroreductase/NAD-dependent dihydropyrimidine dehydrogenase PreA subunit